MIAEDNPLIVKSYEDVVTDAGLSVSRSFTRVNRAKEWLSVHNPDVAILTSRFRTKAVPNLRKCYAAGVPFSLFLAVRPIRGHRRDFQIGALVGKASYNQRIKVGIARPNCVLTSQAKTRGLAFLLNFEGHKQYYAEGPLWVGNGHSLNSPDASIDHCASCPLDVLIIWRTSPRL